jgi:hypothetical protein
MENGERIKYYVQIYLYFVRRATAAQIAAFLNEGPFLLNSGISSQNITNLLKNSALFERKRVGGTWVFVLKE